MEAPNYLDIIEDAKKYFFAEDIMSYFMMSHRFIPNFRIPVTTRCFHLIPRAFNDVIETAVCFLYSRISVFNTFRSFEANEMISRGTFLLFAHHLAHRYFTNGYNPQTFLYFCTHLAYMAISFYKAGKTDVPKLAVYYIVRLMKMYEIPQTEFWNRLSIAALRYVKIAFKCGFVKMSGLESMKIQFVVNRSFKEQTTDDNDGIIEGSATNAVEKSDLLKLSVELKRKISTIDDYYACNENNQRKSEIEKLSSLYEEHCNRELSDYSSTDIKESLEIGMKETLIHENKRDTKCTDLLATTSEFERKLFFQRKYRVFQVLSSLNGPEVSAFDEYCKNLFNTNQGFVSKDMQSSGMDAEPSSSLKSEFDVTSVNSDATERTEKYTKYFDTSKQRIQSSTTVTHDEKLSPSISGDKSGFISANESCKKSPNLASTEESFSTAGKKSARLQSPEEFSKTKTSETEDCLLKTVDFDICDQFVLNIAMTSGTDIELYGETHENFMNNEDNFNSTFDILSVVHNMVIENGTGILDIESIH